MKVIADEIVAIGKSLHAKNMLAAADGNISYRLEDARILITPTGKSKARIDSETLALIDLENRTLQGTPSSEKLMHLTVYRHCPKARAIIHAHPPKAIAWTIAHPHLTELPNRGLSELILAVGSIPIAPYARPGTQNMGDVLIPFLPEHKVILLARHGAISWGEDLEEAHNGIERLEHAAEILIHAMALGGITDLPPEEVQELFRMRTLMGNSTR